MPQQRVSLASTLASTRDPRATEIEEFLTTNAQRLLGALTLITGDRASAEDALQDALAKAWNRREQPIESLAAWLTVVATNHARTVRRRAAAEGRAVDRVARRTVLQSAAPQPVDDQLVEALRALPTRERQVAVLHYVLDQSVAQAAQALGVSHGTVKTLLSRARTHLAASMEAAAMEATPREGGER